MSRMVDDDAKVEPPYRCMFYGGPLNGREYQFKELPSKDFLLEVTFKMPDSTWTERMTYHKDDTVNVWDFVRMERTGGAFDPQ